jgi:antitoxin FitA
MKPATGSGNMTVRLSIKRVPVQLVTRSRRRAVANHRSLQGEVVSILEEAVSLNRASIEEVCGELVNPGLRTAQQSTAMIRQVRDGRSMVH